MQLKTKKPQSHRLCSTCNGLAFTDDCQLITANFSLGSVPEAESVTGDEVMHYYVAAQQKVVYRQKRRYTIQL